MEVKLLNTAELARSAEESMYRSGSNLRQLTGALMNPRATREEWRAAGEVKNVSHTRCTTICRQTIVRSFYSCCCFWLKYYRCRKEGTAQSETATTTNGHGRRRTPVKVLIIFTNLMNSLWPMFYSSLQSNHFVNPLHPATLLRPLLFHLPSPTTLP